MCAVPCSECGDDGSMECQKNGTSTSRETLSTSASLVSSDAEVECYSDSSDENSQVSCRDAEDDLAEAAGIASSVECEVIDVRRKPNPGNLVDTDGSRDKKPFALMDWIGHVLGKAESAIAIETNDAKHPLRQEVLSQNAVATEDSDDHNTIPGRERMPIDVFDEGDCFNDDEIDIAMMSEMPTDQQRIFTSNLPCQRANNRSSDAKFNMKRIVNGDRLRRADDKVNLSGVSSLCDSEQNEENEDPQRSYKRVCGPNTLARFRKFRNDAPLLAQTGVANEDDSPPPFIPVQPSAPFKSDRFRRLPREYLSKREQTH